MFSQGNESRVIGEDLGGNAPGKKTGTAAVELLGPDPRRLRRTAVVGLPDEPRASGRRIDERAGINGAAQARLAQERPARGVGEGCVGRTEGAGGGDRQAVEPGVAAVAHLGRVVEHDPLPAKVEDPRRGLRVDGLPRRCAGKGGRAVALPGVTAPTSGGTPRRVDQRLDVVAQRSAGGKDVVDAARLDDLGITGITGICGCGGEIEGELRGSMDRDRTTRHGRGRQYGDSRQEHADRSHDEGSAGRDRAAAGHAAPHRPHRPHGARSGVASHRSPTSRGFCAAPLRPCRAHSLTRA